MSAVRDTSAISRTLANVMVRDAGAVQRPIVAMMVRDANGLHSVLSAASQFSASPTYVEGSGYSRGIINITTGTTTVSAPTGSTFAWSFANTGWTATAPTSATSAFTAKAGPGNDNSTTAICTVTYQGKTYTVNVDADVSNYYESSGVQN